MRIVFTFSYKILNNIIKQGLNTREEEKSQDFTYRELKNAEKSKEADNENYQTSDLDREGIHYIQNW